METEFLEALYRGGELLAAGQVAEAKEHLERAHALHPEDEKGQNLLGLTCFKLGLFERAGDIYSLLVRANPADPTLRVNLGLVYLKMNALPEAVAQFEVATQLAPEHKKSQNYLGLALAQAGEYARARDHFVLAGSDAMVQKMDRALAVAPEPVAAAPVAAEPVAAEPPAPEQPEVQIDLMSEEVVPDAPLPPTAEVDWGDVIEAAPAPTDIDRAAAAAVDEEARVVDAPAPVELPPPTPSGTWRVTEPALSETSVTSPAEVRPAEPSTTLPTLLQLAHRLRLEPAPQRTFSVESHQVVLQVRGEILTRLSGLVALTGRLELTPELKRFRGRPTDRPFGEADRRMTRVKGTGRIVIGSGDARFLPLDLGEDSAYFREDVVFAFEEGLMFENGVVPSEVAPDLELVHLRGGGQLLLALAGPLSALEVKADAPVTLPMSQIVGWHGNLTPRTVAVGWDAKGKPARGGVELSGEGLALFA